MIFAENSCIIYKEIRDWVTKMKELFWLVVFVVGIEILYQVNPNFAYFAASVLVVYAIHDSFS